MGNRIAYFEVGAQDNEALMSFYRDLFGWRMNPVGDGYALVDTAGGGGISGAIGRSSDGTPWVSFYVGVDDPQAVLDQVRSRGGAAVLPVTEFPGVLTFAMFSDLDGHLVGLVKNEGERAGAPGTSPSAGDGVPVDWFEVLGTDAERTQRFYTELFGWTLNESGFPGYRLVDQEAGEGAIGGGLGSGGDSGNTWATVYAHVSDVEAALAKAEQLGGTRVYGPLDVGGDMKTGALRDPAGNVFGVYQQQGD